MRNTALLLAGVAAAGALASQGAQAGATVDGIKEKGFVQCGVNSVGLPGFAEVDASNNWSGLDIDLCRAVAAALLGDATKVKYSPLNAKERFTALQSGEIDLLSRNTTWTSSRDSALGLHFAGVNYYDGQGFMVPRTAAIASALELSGIKVCVQSGTTSEANAADYFSANNMAFEAILAASAAESLSAYKDGRCGVITSDVSQLYAERLKLADPAEHLILADVISKEPLGPIVRQDDPKWATLIKWVHFALLNAEELGVSSETIDEAPASKKPEVRRLVGVDDLLGEQMGLSRDWAANILRSVGNYGEIYERHLGTDSNLDIPRGLNQLWNRGGIQYAPPIR